MPELCSPVAALISAMMSETRCTLATISPIVLPASVTRREPDSTFSTLAPIRTLISLAASAERWARLRTSLATTAKPRPCSPARAASTAALRARMLVWNAMPSMVPMMSAIFLLLEVISSIVETTCATTVPPLLARLDADWASWFAVWADSAVWRTVLVSCSIELAVCCRLLAASSVRCERSTLPLAISVDAVWMPSVASRTWLTMRARLSRVPATALSSRPSSSCAPISILPRRSPSASAASAPSAWARRTRSVRAVQRTKPNTAIAATRPTPRLKAANCSAAARTSSM